MIEVLRLSHRPFRDKRITTHCALTARAFSADSIAYSGIKDAKMESTVASTVSRFGGNFTISYESNPVSYIKKKKSSASIIIHLTAYGMPLQDKIKEIKNKDCLIIIGSEKVPPEIYSLADYNLSVTSQPHSEVAALSIFLHEYHQGKELAKDFSNAKVKIIPQEKGKLVNSKLYK